MVLLVVVEGIYMSRVMWGSKEGTSCQERVRACACICFGVNDDFLCFFTGEEVIFLFLWRAGFRTGFQVNPSLPEIIFSIGRVSVPGEIGFYDDVCTGCTKNFVQVFIWIPLTSKEFIGHEG